MGPRPHRHHHHVRGHGLSVHDDAGDLAGDLVGDDAFHLAEHHLGAHLLVRGGEERLRESLRVDLRDGFFGAHGSGRDRSDVRPLDGFQLLVPGLGHSTGCDDRALVHRHGFARQAPIGVQG